MDAPKTTDQRKIATGTEGGGSAISIARTDIDLHPDPRRVIIRPFLPDEQVFPDGGLLDRILALSEDEVASTLAETRTRFEDRHVDLETVLEKHHALVDDETDLLPGVSRQRRLLIGAYYTREFSIEAAALTNPSIVPAPDQSGLGPGAQRFIMSVRGIGEGQVSSIEFRSGVIDARAEVIIDPCSRFAITGSRQPTQFDKASFSAKLDEMDELDKYNEMAAQVLDPLPEQFELRQLEDAIVAVEGKRAPRRLSDPTARAIRWLANSNYDVTFPLKSEISERVLFAGSAIESHGLEDARFVLFTDDDGSVTYYATYTAYDGVRVLPQLIETADFVSFRIATLSGICARNKGAALFPRKIDGRYTALSRYDGQDNYVIRSNNVRIWEEAERIESPAFPWDLARIGNCGSPLETEAGWLVITHGVGPLRTYSLGAILLDIDDPCQVLGRLEEPLLVPSEEEREGYVPNVVYSCGSMIHGDHLVLPYGHADVATRIALVPMDELLSRLVG